MVMLCPSICTVTTAADPSGDTPPVTCVPNGSLTAETWLMVFRWVIASSTGVRTAASRTDVPGGATTTSRAVDPLTCGNVCASASIAVPDSVPGMENVLSVPLASSFAPPSTSRRIPSQARTTRTRAPNDQRPSR